MPEFSFDEPSVVSTSECDECGQPVTTVTGFVLRHGDAHAIFMAQCTHHGGHEAWIHVVFSDVWNDNDARHTFACRVFPDGDDYAMSLIDAVWPAADATLRGEQLSREEALASSRLDELWPVVEFVVRHDPTVASHLGD
jgi:hypothetical protein